MTTAAAHFPHLDPAPIRTADLLAAQLRDAGVEMIFGLPGGAIAAFNDALLNHPQIRVITSHHESGAMFAACGYARLTGKLAVVVVTSGPGLLNAMTGLASAFCDGLPVLIVAGEVPRSMFGKHAMQEGTAAHLNVMGMTQSITKWNAAITHESNAAALFQHAMQVAVADKPGPVLLTLPLDVAAGRATPCHFATPPTNSALLSESVIAQASRSLAAAQRPVILAGSGVRADGGAELLRALAEAYQIPVMTSPKAKGVFPESHPLALGIFGYGGHPSALDYLRQGVDVVLVVGAGLSDIATNGWSPLLKPTHAMIQIDIDATTVGRHYPVTQALIGRAALILQQLLQAAVKSPREIKQFGVKRVHLEAATHVEAGSPGSVEVPQALVELQQILPINTLYSCDIGEHLGFVLHYLTLEGAQDFLLLMGLSSMGSSIGAAMGAKLAAPHRPVVAICGDGGFAMSASEIATAAREGIPMIIAVFNDQRYGMVELGHTALYGRTPAYPLATLSIDVLARGYGAQAVVISQAGELLQNDLVGMAKYGPVVLDIRINRAVKFKVNQRFDHLMSKTSN